MDLEAIGRVFRLIDREIWIITAAAPDGRRGGLTATAVLSASLDPQRPMLLVGITPNHYTAELITASGTFAAHLLRPDQGPIAWNFADGSGRDRDKLAGLKLADLATNTNGRGVPILADCLAWLECRTAGRFTEADRIFFWADVIVGEQFSSGPPLRENAFISSLTDSQRQQLAAAKAEDLNRRA
ncbi:MAG: flavin reductase family protein [Planctomycetaceae bacterium]|nr:flavin reductase family protein [Planctomycetaceae bacterium]